MCQRGRALLQLRIARQHVEVGPSKKDDLVVRPLVHGVDFVNVGWQTVPKRRQFHGIIIAPGGTAVATTLLPMATTRVPMNTPKMAAFKGPHFTADYRYRIKISVAPIGTATPLHENGL